MINEVSQIGSKIRKLREFQHLTQEYLANGLGISQQAYSKIESDTSSLTVTQLISISEILGVSPSAIIDDEAHQIIFHFSSSNNNNKGNISAGSHLSSQKESVLYERMLQLLKDENEMLKAQIQVLQKIIENKLL